MDNVQSLLEERYLLRRKSSLVVDCLLDADALVALAKKDDSNHSKALKINSLLQKTGVSYSLSPFTVAEAVTVLSYKVSHRSAISFLIAIRKIDIPIFSLPEKYQHLPDKYFLKQAHKKRVSYFDCYNMALLDRYKQQISLIFSFDSVYKKNGFKTTETLLR